MLQGDPTKARVKLGWQPRVNVDEPVRRMVDYDFELVSQEKTLMDAGHVFLPRRRASQ